MHFKDFLKRLQAGEQNLYLITQSVRGMPSPSPGSKMMICLVYSPAAHSQLRMLACTMPG